MTDAAFWEGAHARLSALFQPTDPPYAGYKPGVREAPNGDTRACEARTPAALCAPYDQPARSDPYSRECLEAQSKRLGDHAFCLTCNGTGRVPNVDTGKRYLHVARKYDPPKWALAWLARAHWEACIIAERIGVPADFYPRTEDGTLRVLEYPSAACEWTRDDSPSQYCKHCARPSTSGELCPPSEGCHLVPSVCPARAAGAGTAEHTDFDLFTVNLWRSTPEDHEQILKRDPAAPGVGPDFVMRGAEPYHIGEIGELVGLGRAVPHRVPARPYSQRALVYFAMPSHAARLPPFAEAWRSRTVGEWLKERVSRSRVKVNT